MRPVLLSLVLALLIPPAQAQTPKRGQNRVLFDEPTPVSTDALAERARLQEMEMAEEMLKRPLDDTRKGELVLRLAELYFQEGRVHYLREMDGFQVQLDACLDAGQDCSTVVPDHSESAAWQDKSIRLYQALLERYPQHPRTDEATFYMAASLEELERFDEALNAYRIVVRNYPDSRFVADALVQIGDHYFFRKDDAFKALVAYRKATAYRSNDKYAYALYMLAWTTYNVGDPEEALTLMKRVVAHSEALIDSGQTQGAIELRDEAYRDIVRFCADVDQPEGCFAYLEGRGKSELVIQTMTQLAETYAAQGQRVEAVLTWKRLIAKSPAGPQAAAWQAEIVRATRDGGELEATLAELGRLVRDYGPASAWAQKMATQPDAIRAAQARSRSEVRTTAVELHGAARKLGTGEAAVDRYEAAERLYTLHLDSWPEDAAVMRFGRAEVRYTLEHFGEAWVDYDALAQLEGLPKGLDAEFIAAASVHAAQKVVESEGPVEGDTARWELSEWDARLLSCLDRYVERFPSNEKRLGMEYEAAWLLYRHNQFTEAAPRFRSVIQEQPDSEQAELAANLILDSLALVEDWGALQATAQEFADSPRLGSAGFRTEAQQIAVKARFQGIEAMEDRRAAGEALLAFADELPRDPLADQALNNAAVYLSEAGHALEADAARRVLVDQHPQSEHAVVQLEALAFSLESRWELDEAVERYEALAEASQDKREVALLSAAVFREAMGDREIALAQWSALATVPGEGQARAAERAASLAVDLKDSSASKRIAAALEHELEPEAELRLRNEQVKLTGKVDVRVDELMAEGVASEAVGAERLRQLVERAEAFRAISLSELSSLSERGREKELSTNGQARFEALAELEAATAEVLGTGSGRHGVAALTLLAECYADMGEALSGAWMPAYLSADQEALYREAVSDRVAVMESRAAATVTAALGRASELSLYGDESQAAFALARELDGRASVEELMPPAPEPVVSLSVESARAALDGAQGWMELAVAHYAVGELALGRLALARVELSAEDWELARTAEGDALLVLGDRTAAGAAWREALAFGAALPARHRLAQLAVASGDLDGAAELVSGRVDLESRWIAAAVGQDDWAEVLALAPQHPELQLAAARAALHRGELELAEARVAERTDPAVERFRERLVHARQLAAERSRLDAEAAAQAEAEAEAREALRTELLSRAGALQERLASCTSDSGPALTQMVDDGLAPMIRDAETGGELESLSQSLSDVQIEVDAACD